MMAKVQGGIPGHNTAGVRAGGWSRNLLIGEELERRGKHEKRV